MTNIIPIRDSTGFRAGQDHERRRVGDLLRQRVRDLRNLHDLGLPTRTVRLLTSEVMLLITAIEESGQT